MSEHIKSLIADRSISAEQLAERIRTMAEEIDVDTSRGSVLDRAIIDRAKSLVEAMYDVAQDISPANWITDALEEQTL